MHKGSCLCGGVTFEVSCELSPPSACHCRECRKHSGHFEASVDVPRSALTVSGADNVKWYSSSEKVRRGFCENCGSSLFWDPLDQQKQSWTSIALGAFDTPTNTKLKQHIFVGEKGDYYDLNDGLPQIRDPRKPNDVVLDNFKIVKFDEEKHRHLIEQLTEMLHSAYRPLADKGLKYLATHQSSDITLRRLKKGDSFLGFIDGELISTITVVKEDPNEPCEWYKKPEVYFFTQFAVKPAYQGLGLGKRLMDFIERYASDDGAKEIALDTSEHAHHLISMYKNRNYRFIEYAQWDVTNYRSVILSKTLQDAQ